MRIVSIITGLNCGGAENLLLGICKNNKKTNKEQIVIYLTEKEYLLDEFKDEGIKTLFVDVAKAGVLKAIFQIRKVIKGFKPDVVNTHLVMADTLGRAACLFMKNVKVFSTIHSMDEWKTEKNLMYKMLKMYNRVTINCFKNNYLIAVSDNCRRFCMDYERIKGKKIFVVQNYVIEDRTGEPVKREALGLKEGDFVFVNVGRMEAQKQQMDILKAAKELKRRGMHNVKFLIIGDGSLRGQLEEYINENDLSDAVILQGFVRNVYNYFFISNMMLFSSAIEGFGLAIWEAFYNRLPVLGSGIPTTRELIIHGETGLLYEMGDISRLVSSIEDVVGGKYDTERMADAAYEFCKKRLKFNFYDKLYQTWETK